MLKILKNRFEQGYRTSQYPKVEVTLHPSYRGRPELNRACPPELAARCAAACPQEAIDSGQGRIDLGRCVFCGQCERLSEGNYIRFTQDFALGVANREDLVLGGGALPDLASHAQKHFRKLFGRSLQLRQVSAGGCNSCEADTNVLMTPFFDLARFGIQFVASPRHADGLHVTGPVSKNMRGALLATYEAVPGPKVVIASGSCSLSGGPFRGSPEQADGLHNILPVDLFIPGCPPHPMTTLHALLNYFK